MKMIVDRNMILKECKKNFVFMRLGLKGVLGCSSQQNLAQCDGKW